MRTDVTFDVVVPTIGRPSLGALLRSLGSQTEPVPGRIIVVDDRRGDVEPLRLEAGSTSVDVLRGAGGGPAAARNIGWRTSDAPWVAFVDDDVLPPSDWVACLRNDLAHLSTDVGGSQGRIVVPLPDHRSATDWERNVARLEGARWATADLCYRREALEAVGGFDERFPRAYREDSDLGLRVTAAGYRIVIGERTVQHPVRRAGTWTSVRLQAGNRDDALMARLHGRGWRTIAGAPPGRLRRHVATTAAGWLAIVAWLLDRPNVASIGGAVWALMTAGFAWARLREGPGSAREITTVIATSILIPPVATYHWLVGLVRARLISRGGPSQILRGREPSLVGG